MFFQRFPESKVPFYVDLTECHAYDEWIQPLSKSLGLEVPSVPSLLLLWLGRSVFFLTFSIYLFIPVSQRHHVRFFPSQNRAESDQSGNCRAGTVVDREISHPTEFDFYLQSHAGLLGTSRPAHYNVLLDENNFTPDSLQQLSFALCHVYARSTRSVSIPAPVYCLFHFIIHFGNLHALNAIYDRRRYRMLTCQKPLRTWRKIGHWIWNPYREWRRQGADYRTIQEWI